MNPNEMNPNWESQLRTRLAATLEPEVKGVEADAGVLLAIFTDGPEPEVLLTRRAETLSSHAGEVAFPGGKCDASDRNVIHTALRETEEEVALRASRIEIVGQLPQAASKAGLAVVPVVGLVRKPSALVPNEAEIDSIFKVPLRYFLQAPPSDIILRQFRGGWYEVPCYRYEGYEIWGLTAYILWNFCNQVFDAGFELSLPRAASRLEDASSGDSNAL